MSNELCFLGVSPPWQHLKPTHDRLDMTILALTPAASSFPNPLLQNNVLKNTFIKSTPHKPNFTDTNYDLRKTVSNGKFSDSDSSALVVRGNPRISVADTVEFPFSNVEPTSRLYMARARMKRRYTQAEQLEYRHEKRSTLYAGMATAGKILPNYINKTGQVRQHSVCLCRRFMQTHENAQSYVTLSVDSNHIAKFTDLIVCDNTWLCPVCSSVHLDTKAAEITEVQKNFLAAGRDKHWSTWMLTLTIPHTRSDKLDDLLTKKSAVMSEFHAHSAIKKLKARIGWQGYVDSLEIRHSNANGWHPHHHILGFFTNMHPNTRVQCVYDAKRDYYRIATQADKKRSIELHKIEVQKYIYHIFAYLCVKNGLKRPSVEYGVDFRESDDIQDYLTKQSKIAHELTAEHNKKSDYSRSQWEILRDCESDNAQLSTYSRALFCEFAEATRGRAKLHWSPDFKRDWLEKDDEEFELEIEDSEETTNDKIYKISCELWNRFFTSPDRRFQRQLLEIAENDSFNNTQNTELVLLVARILLNIEKQKNEQLFIDEQERLFQEWLKIPPSPSPHFEYDFRQDYQYY